MNRETSTTVGALAIRPLEPSDWERVREIYGAGMATGIATFETVVPSAEELDQKWIPEQRWVATSPSGRVLGWAVLSPTSSRSCYRGVVETSVYVAPESAGRGVGRALVDHQVRAAVEAGFWTLQSSIFAENHASLALHRSAGFREVGIRERIAQRDGVWHDTVLIEFRANTP